MSEKFKGIMGLVCLFILIILCVLAYLDSYVRYNFIFTGVMDSLIGYFIYFFAIVSLAFIGSWATHEDELKKEGE